MSMEIPELIGWFALAVLVDGVAFYRFASKPPRESFNNWLIAIFALGLSWNFAEKYCDFMHLDSRLLLGLFFLIPHAVAFFAAYLVVRWLDGE
jgi:hypothetical protein